MFHLFRLFLFSILLSLTLDASAYSYNISKFNEAKKNYTKIIGSNQKIKEVKYLKKLIYFGTKVNKKVYKYKKELERLEKKTTIFKKEKITQKSKYSIQKVYQQKNQIIISFNRQVSKKDIHYFIKKGNGHYQYIFDIQGRFKDANPTKLSLDDVDTIKIVQYRFKTLRISFINKEKIKPIYIIGNKKIIIKVNQKKIKVVSNYYSKNKRKTIVIDAGHGGRDVGAIGFRGRYEKTVVLNISKYLSKILKRNGYDVFLTRNRDKYVSLKDRTKLANKKNADIFISIHANAARKSRVRKAKGIETYFLSPARSKRAKRVAALENKADMNTMNWSSKSTLLTVLNQGKITASNKIAIDIQRNMLLSLRNKYGKKAIRDGGVREGPFWVLVGVQMPSVLIEVGYISHPDESKRIHNTTYQKTIAQAIANGINSYFAKNQ